MDERIEDLLALYVLGGLTDEEALQVEAYLAVNPAAAAERDSLLAVVDALPYAAAPMQPPAAVEAELMARAAADARQRFDAGTTPAAEQNGRSTPRPAASASGPSIGDWLRGLFRSPLVGGVGYALALALFIWAFVLLGRNNGLQSENRTLTAAQQTMTGEVAELTAENESLAAANESLAAANAVLENRVATLAAENEELFTRVSDLAEAETQLSAEVDTLQAANEQLAAQMNTLVEESDLARRVLAILTSPEVDAVTVPGNPETQPQAQGQLVVDASSNTAILIVTGMEPLPAGSVYQVLLIQGSDHETAETFEVDTRGDGVLIVSSENPLGIFDAVGVSIEPEGGSEQRTGEIVLLGSLVN